jgi:hypothetical protein
MHDVKLWLDLLLDHSRFKRPSKAKVLSLAIAYSHMGFCHIKKDEVEDAVNSWKQSLATYRSMENPPDFGETWPAISLALLYALQGRPNEGIDCMRQGDTEKAR